MNAYYHDKVFLTVCSILSSSITAGVGLVSEGDVRWACMTMAVSILVACFLSLGFRKPTESIKVVIGRAGITLVAGVFGTRALVHFLALDHVNDDVFLLGAFSAAVSLVAYFPGHGLIKSLDRETISLGGLLKDVILALLKIPNNKDKNP